ncbi:unnamed protein product [Cylindrotheca closterium]|uniref:DUF647 domain-containing protein n=1 Tax=Cylindrotheca closterium TaxID=2856 RepID=A0AAD2G048_9STRA|nr:unnamed protein product [Cylindrotheca closterium]
MQRGGSILYQASGFRCRSGTNRLRTLATSSTRDATKESSYRVWQVPPSLGDGDPESNGGILFERDASNKWRHLPKKSDTSFDVMELSKQAMAHFLPAQYPKSVAPGYFKFVSYYFIASVAGSASMVLSTQTLLLAVGVAGANAHQAGIMAGAFNWVMKDFAGQVGGVLFASQMGKTKSFDTDPKRWRMVSAMTLDGATLLEILSPLFHASLVLPVASVANVGKNIGFLTASASKAAIHNSLAIQGNLGDVTAKAGSQAIVASLMGTTLGIGMSSFLGHDTFKFSLGFCVLAAVHQGCNYFSLKEVPLSHFNRQRLHLVLKHYIEEGEILSPKTVAVQEEFLPLPWANKPWAWLSIGSPITSVCPDPEDWNAILQSTPSEKYVLRHSSDRIHLVFLSEASGEDIIRAVFHAHQLENLKPRAPIGTARVEESYQLTLEHFPILLDKLEESGWKTATESISVESSKSYRVHVP